MTAAARAIAPTTDANRVAEPFLPLRDGYNHLTEHGVPVFTDMPARCIIRHMSNEMHAPYISTGEAAVIDVADRELVLGKLYLYQQMRNDQVWHITTMATDGLKLNTDEPCGMLHPLHRLKVPEGKTFDDVLDDMRKDAPRDKLFGIPVLPLFLSDGPLPLDAIAERIIGRVVGVL